MKDFCVVYITTSSFEEAETLGKELVNQKIAACAQISGPIKSIYSWKGEDCEEEEHRLTIKTRTDLFADLEQFVKSNHSYEVPQIVAVPIISASQEYLNWIAESTRTT